MPSKTRGAIEEGTVVFNQETEKVITFTAASVQNKNFPSPPVVKLISAGTSISQGRVQKNLLFNDDGTQAHSYPAAGTTSIFNVESTNSPVASGYSWLNTIPTIAKSKNMGQGSTVTIPFDNAGFTTSSFVQIFFQIKFTNFDNLANDNVTIRFVNKTTIDASSDSTPVLASQTIKLNSSVFINDSAAWDKLVTSTSLNNIDFNMQGILAVKTDVNTDGLFHWFRLDLKSGTGSIADLAGISVFNGGTAAGETIQITDVILVEYPSGIRDDGDPTNTDLVNSNIGVSFTDVTTTGMRVTTTAPFTGEIRYLCTVQG